MISLKKYLDSAENGLAVGNGQCTDDLLAAAIDGYSAALVQMSLCGRNACPAVGSALHEHLTGLARALSSQMNPAEMSASNEAVQQQLRQWGLDAANHYHLKSEEIKQLLLAMLRTAEGVGVRDQRCAGQIHEVTKQLKAVASLDDLSLIRARIENSAALLKSSIDRMAEEGKAAMDGLRRQVTTYQTKLEEAEQLALRDPLTGVRNRSCVERQIERYIGAGENFCAAIIDIDGFKQVNDRYGHLSGDELLKQFAGELVSAARSTDVVGRWGGDEFILLLKCPMADATRQAERLERWICGNYTIESQAHPIVLTIRASIGLAEYRQGEEMKDLLARADQAMYRKKPQAAAARLGY
jgi:diguanylate cyclase (GGDEF)-like protein